MIKRRALALILAAGFVVGSYATDARVAVMGRQSTPWFYRDEVSVFSNPADMSLYPNMLYGSFGWVPAPAGDQQNFYYQYNLAVDPHFGAMISHRFSEEENGPMFSFGAFLNRRDNMVDKLMMAGGTDPLRIADTNRVGYNLPEPVGKLDLMFGYDLGNGLAIGLGGYAAFQTIKQNDNITAQTEFYKGSLGVNWNIEQGLDLEAAFNAGFSNASYLPIGVTYRPDSVRVVSDGDYFIRGDVRFFSAVPAINGSFVPQVSLEFMELAEKKVIDLNGGVGINMNIDRGFFWAGLQGVYTQTDSVGGANESIGARISFGIERNIMWDWFLIRVGGQKVVRHETKGNNSTWWENNPSDGSDGDLVGLGFGINIDNRLRIDFVASEDLPYTFTNLISGNTYNLFNRVSATYRF
ncbi:MAG: hypothetical protein FWB85_06375 [Chitinispirillia bacterium]|nr:hypothetical protein [Chitinispirillia bacterium]MCL2241835.1 hypothetical protein [Chitinispirillia bacterium]